MLPQKDKKQAHRAHRGFTLVEVIVIFAFAMALTSLILIGYRRIATTGALQRAAQRFVQDIRRAQVYAITTDPTRFAGATPPCGYGLHWPDPSTGDPNSYAIYARQIAATNPTTGLPVDPLTVDCVGREPRNSNTASLQLDGVTPASTTVSVVNAYTLPEAGHVQFSLNAVPGDFLTTDIYFLPPDPQAVLVANNAGGTPYVSPGPCTTVPCSVTTTIVLTSDPAQRRSVLVYDSGRVEIR